MNNGTPFGAPTEGAFQAHYKDELFNTYFSKVICKYCILQT